MFAEPMPHSIRLLIATLLVLSPFYPTGAVLATPKDAVTTPVVPPLEATAHGAVNLILAQAIEPETAEPADPVPPPGARGGLTWWWVLLPVAGAAAIVWALTQGKRQDDAVAPTDSPEPPVPVGPSPTVPPTEPLLEAEIPPVAAPPEPAFAPESLESETVDPVVSALEPGEVDRVSPLPVPPETVPPATVPPPVAPPLAAVEPPAPNPEVTPDPVQTTSLATPTAPGVIGGAGAAGLATSAMDSLANSEEQSAVEASKYNVVGRPADQDLDLSTIDDGLPPLPTGYGESRIVLMPRDPQWAYIYWDAPHTHKEALRRQGGERLALRFYDVTDINLEHQTPHNMQQIDCDELAREWYVQIPVSDRDYQVDIGYLSGDGRWLVLARSNTIRIPPVYPSDWSEDHFMTVGWEENLTGKTLITLVDPRAQDGTRGLHDQMYTLSQGADAQRIAGSLYGSMQHIPGSMAPPLSSHVFPSGMGMGAMAPGAVPTVSGLVGPTPSGYSGFTPSGYPGYTMSGIAGLTLSGVGFSASMPLNRPRKFWLVADAELIVYGATEPDATVTISGVPIQLNDDGTFRFQTSFQDGTIDYPIMAVAADGEQSRSIHMTFERQTPDRRTNTPEEAQEEWPGT
jgi:hypothetical protein